MINFADIFQAHVITVDDALYKLPVKSHQINYYTLAIYITKIFQKINGSSSRHLLAFCAVRVKGGKSLRNGMWHGVRNGIIMQNTIYVGNKLTEERILFSRQFYKSSSFLDVADY